MLALYRSLNISTRLIFFVALEAIVGAVTFRNYGVENLPLAIGASAAILLLVDALARRLSIVLALVTALGQIFLLSLIALYTDSLIFLRYGVNTNGLYYLLITSSLLFVLAVQVGLATYIARGRIWVNLMVSSLIVDLTFMILVNVFRQDFSIAALVALGFVLLYFVGRSLRWRRHIDAELPRRSPRSVTKASKFFEKRDYTVTLATEKYRYLDFVAINGNSVYAVMTLDPRESVKLSKGVLVQDEADITSAFEYALRDMRRWARDKRVPLNQVQCVLFTHKTTLNPDYQTLRIRKRQTPDRSLGQISLVSHSGMDKLIRAHRVDRAFGKRLTNRLTRLA